MPPLVGTLSDARVNYTTLLFVMYATKGSLPSSGVILTISLKRVEIFSRGLVSSKHWSSIILFIQMYVSLIFFLFILCV